MKTETFQKWCLGLLVAALPLAGGCDSGLASSAPVVSPSTNPPSTAVIAATTNAPTPEVMEEALATAPGEVVSTAAPPPPTIALSAAAREVAKLAQAGVDESVMLSFVTNSANTFNLSSDAIIYLNDIGVSSTVVAAMLQHDQNGQATSATAVAQVDTNQLIPAPGTANPYAPPQTATVESQSPPPYTESEPPAEQVNVTYSYFYDSLAPYGNWISVSGYGLCWQPSVVVVNRGWQPYGDRGHWVYSDYGWYWASDYSWGWAPFHYGRWFQHQRWGWCWAPDTVWGPSWVSWRYSPTYCGWAPLPPTACFTPGIGFTYFGRHVGFGFSFGLPHSAFTVVGFNHFTDRHWRNYRASGLEARRFFDHSRISNRIVERKGKRLNEGVPISHVTAVSGKRIPRIQLRDAPDPASAHAWRTSRDQRSLYTYRLNAPTPSRKVALVGQGIEAKPGSSIRANGATTPGNRTSARNFAAGAPRNNQAPANFVQPPARGSVQPLRSVPGAGSEASLAPRSWDRSGQSGVSQLPARQAPDRRSANQNQSLTPVAPAQAAAPGQNDRRFAVRNQEQSTIRSESPARTQPQVQPQNQRYFRQQAPNQPRQDQRVTIQPAPRPNQPVVRTRGWPPAAEPREQQRWVSPAQHSGQQFVAPRAQAIPQTRSIQAAPHAPAQAQSFQAPSLPQVQSRQAPSGNDNTQGSQRGGNQGNSARHNR